MIHSGQLVMVSIDGKVLDKAQADFLREQHIRAVCLFRHELGSDPANPVITERSFTENPREGTRPAIATTLLGQTPALSSAMKSYMSPR